MSIALLFIISWMLTVVFLLEFKRRMKKKDFRIWLFCCLVISIIVFIVSGFAVSIHLLDKFYPTWIAAIIAIVLSLSLMVMLKESVNDEIKKFKSLKLKETKSYIRKESTNKNERRKR